MADRYAYIPLLGIFVMGVWGAADAMGERGAKLAFAAGVAVLTALTTVARPQIATWENSLTLWSHALAVTRNNFVAEDNLGNALVTQGRYEEALPHFQRAAAINPRDPLSQLNLGAYYQQHGDPQASLEHTQKVAQLTADPALLSNALGNLGAAYRSQGNYKQARSSYEVALRMNPNDAIALVGLGLVEYKEGRYPQASNYYYRAMLIHPTAVGYLLTARALEHAGQHQAAQAARAQAEKLSNDMAQAQDSADRLLAQ